MEADNIQQVDWSVLLCPYFWGSDLIVEEMTNTNEKFIFDLGWAITGVELDHPWMNPLVEGVPSLAGLGLSRVFVCLAELDMWVWRGKLTTRV